MNKLKFSLFFLFFVFCLSGFFNLKPKVLAEDNKNLDEIKKQIEEYEKKIDDLRDQQKTLANAIAYLNNNIGLTNSKIAETESKLQVLEEEIKNLGLKIDDLDLSLNKISEIFASRTKETYKRSKLKPFYLFFSSSGFGDYLSKLKYLKLVQEHDRALLFELEGTRETFDQQKKFKEEKQKEFEALKQELKNQELALAQQKKDKQGLLTATKNDEKSYQEKIASLVAELEAIQGIISGKGEEVQVGEVNPGNKIATIINGNSACSTGTHLHFEVNQGGGHTNPAGYLKNLSVNYDSGVVPMNFSGSWDWPVDEPVRMTQEYGETLWTRTGQLWYKFHTGIDLFSSSLMVKAVKEGTLYRGSISCGGGTLRYVKVDHKDSDIDTYYLHVNYY